MLIAQQVWLRLIGGIFLCYLGARTLLSKPVQELGRVSGQGLGRDYASTFLLTITNPMTILSFLAVFVGIGAGSLGDYTNAAFFVAGVFAGSMLWWTTLAAVVGLLFRRFDARKLRIINAVSGVILLGFGGYLLLTCCSACHRVTKKPMGLSVTFSLYVP